MTLPDDELEKILASEKAQLELRADIGVNKICLAANEQKIQRLEGELAEAIASHQKQNKWMQEFEDVFCDEHLDNLPKRCPVCELASTKEQLRLCNIDQANTEVELTTLNKAYIYHMQKTDAELAEARKGRRDALRMLRCCREWVFEGTKLYEDIEEWIAVAYRDITKEAQ